MEQSHSSVSHASRAFPLPTITEDTLHYALHLSPSTPHPAALATLITAHIESLLVQPWLWNRDRWELKVVGPQLLEGTMRVGDAVDDEWLVVWLLREVSRRWPQLVISIRDSDGEFLLIEAANELPSWLSPDNADNRLWLYSGRLHLLPLSVRSVASRPKQIGDEEYDAQGNALDSSSWVNEVDALTAVRTDRYVADVGLEKAIWNRIACYPAALKTHQHRTKAYLPIPVAKALSVSPYLIQRAVESFYVRDPAQLRAASRMTHFPPSSAVLTSVLMTRAAYAQLQGQIFHAPRIFGPEWNVHEGSHLDDERRWRDLGAKIATGFEIMYREGGKKGRTADVEASTDSCRSDPDYKIYIASLRAAGFFGDELEGSQKWQAREIEAAKGWNEARSADTAQQRQSFAYLVDRAVQSYASPLSELEVARDSPEDSTSWLEVSPDELDMMLLNAAGGSTERVNGEESGNKNEELGEEHGKALHNLAKRVEQFVGGQGDLEGARFADELSDDDFDSDSESDVGETEPDREQRLKNLVPALPAEEWGSRSQIPADEAQTIPSSSQTSVKFMSMSEDPPSSMRPPVFAKPEYDGVVDESSDEDDEGDLPPPGTLGRKIAEMKWGEGIDRSARIEEIDENYDENNTRKLQLDEDIDAQMYRRVWGQEDEPDEDMDVDPDMGEEEEEFLKFSRDALGISDDMWENILSTRRARGAFVPEQSAKKELSTTLTSKQPVMKKSVQSRQEQPNHDTDKSLNSFEQIMQAMDSELARAKGSSHPSLLDNLATLPTENDIDDMDEDELAAMDRELRAAMNRAGIESDEEEQDLDIAEARLLDGDQRREYKMMRDFLESYRSQTGQSGVVGNLFGRLGE